MDARLVGLKEYVLDLLEMPLRIKEMVIHMADQSQVLNEVAEKLRGPVYSSVTALIERNRELEGEDAGESQAATNVVLAMNDLAAVFSPADLPDVPVIDQPAADEDDDSEDDSNA